MDIFFTIFFFYSDPTEPCSGRKLLHLIRQEQEQKQDQKRQIAAPLDHCFFMDFLALDDMPTPGHYQA